METKKGRQRYLINPQFQLSVIAWVLVLAILSLAILYGANHYLIWKLWSIGETLQLPMEHPFFSFVREQRRLTWSILFWSGSAISAVITIGGIFLSHKIAGPIYRIQSSIERWAESGNAEEIKFRKGDYFPELAESINTVIRKSKRSS